MSADGDSIKKQLQLSGISWQHVTYSNSLPVISPVLILYRMWQMSVRLLNSEKFVLVHCRSTLPAIIGYKLKKKFSVKLIYDMRGFWADERVEGNIWPKENRLYRMIYNWVKRKETELLSGSDHIISLTQAGKIIMENDKTSPVKIPITVIPCCADFNHFNPESIPAEKIANKKKELSIADTSSVIIYTGSIGTWYMLDEMLAFFSVYKSKKPGSIFLFVTRENHEMIYDAAAKYQLGKEDIRVVSSSRTEMPLWLALADASLYFIRPGFSKQASSPVKQGESVAMGLPVITNSGIGDSDRLIAENNFGWMVAAFSQQAYQHVVDSMTEKTDRNKIRESARAILSLEAGVKSYREVYSKILKK